MAEYLAAVPAPVLLVVVALGLVVESGLLVGVLVPGTALALMAGAAAQADLVPLPAALAATALGTLAGGRLGHLTGRRRRGRSAPFAGPARLLQHLPAGAGSALLTRPSMTVAVGQWLSVGRVVVPRAAGWSGVEPSRFGLVHTPSALAWAAALTGIGYAASAAARGWVSDGLAALAVVVVLTVVVRGWRRSQRARSQLLGRRAACITIAPVPALVRPRHMAPGSRGADFRTVGRRGSGGTRCAAPPHPGSR